MSYNHWRNIQSSLLRFCSDFKDKADVEGFDLDVVFLDGFTDEAQWPDKDFIGLGEFNVDIQEYYSGQCVIALSTKEDTNLYRIGQLVELILDDLLPGSQIKAMDAQTGEVIGSIFVLNGVRVGTPMPTKSQPIQPIMISFETDLVST